MINRLTSIFKNTILILLTITVMNCENGFLLDGEENTGINKSTNYYYLIDNESNSLIMMDNNLAELKRWSMYNLCEGNDVQGITTDGGNIWISVASSVDAIFKVYSDGDTLRALRSFDAPEDKKGVIRDLAWLNGSLWAINSGSVSASIPPKIYKLDPSDGTIIEEYELGTLEPRAMTYVDGYTDVYGRGADEGFYFTDSDVDKVYKFDIEKKVVTEVFDSPEPPRGISYKFPIGLHFEQGKFWLVNSSSAGDHLYLLNYKGQEEGRFELPYTKPGRLRLSSLDIREAPNPEVLSVSPNVSMRDASLSVIINGGGFLPGNGLQVDFGSGITISNVAFVDVTSISADIDIAADAAIGKRNVTVTNPDGKVGVGDSVFSVSEFDPSTGYIWISDFNSGTLWKIQVADTNDREQWNVGSFSGSNSTQGLAFDGNNMWMSIGGSEDRIFKLDSISAGVQLSAISSITAPPSGGGVVREIAFDGNGFLWAANNDVNTIYQLDKSNGSILDSITAPGTEIRGIVFANGNLYCNDRTIDSVFVYNASSQEWNSVFEIPIPPGGSTSNRYSTGMSWDGANFWIANSSFEYDYVYQVSLTGQVIRTIEVPNRGDAQPGGIAYTRN